MKVKFLNILTVGLITLAVLSPGLVVFGVIWGRHIQLVKTQNLFCQVNNNNISDDRSLTFQTHRTPTFPTQASTKPPDHNLLTRLRNGAEQYYLATILQWLFLFIPICIGLVTIGYDRYLVYRAAVFQEQVAMLERLWQQSIEQ